MQQAATHHESTDEHQGKNDWSPITIEKYDKEYEKYANEVFERHPTALDSQFPLEDDDPVIIDQLHSLKMQISMIQQNQNINRCLESLTILLGDVNNKQHQTIDVLLDVHTEVSEAFDRLSVSTGVFQMATSSSTNNQASEIPEKLR